MGETMSVNTNHNYVSPVEDIYHAVTSERLFEAVVKQVETLIIAERLSVGDAIPSERRLAELFGVSRSVVREAMRALERAGLVEIKPGRGAYVKGLSPESVSKPLSLLIQMRRGSIQDCLEFRRYLEPPMASLAAARRSRADIQAMYTAQQGMDEIMDRPEQFIEYDLAFHSALAGATGNPVFLLVLDPIIGLIQQMRQQTMHLSGAFASDQNDHHQILERVKEGDAAGAEVAMRLHLDSVTRQLEVAKGM